MVGEREFKFYNELKQMNEDLLAYIKEANQKSPYFDFTPTFEDYIKQIEDLQKQYPEKTGDSPAPKTNLFNINATPFVPSVPTVPNSQAAPLSKPPVPTFSFGLSSSTTQPLIFGAAPSSQTTTTAPPSSLFSFGLPKKNEEESTNTTGGTNNANDADDDDAPPPDTTVDKYEEPNSKYSVKCKLYEKSRVEGQSASLMGLGQLYLKAMDTPNKIQVIFRQEPDLRRVLMNNVVTPSMSGQFKLLPKAVQMMFPSATGEIKFYITKVRDEKDAKELFDHLTMNK